MSTKAVPVVTSIASILEVIVPFPDPAGDLSPGRQW
jgi:hypothetical protein